MYVSIGTGEDIIYVLLGVVFSLRPALGVLDVLYPEIKGVYYTKFLELFLWTTGHFQEMAGSSDCTSHNFKSCGTLILGFIRTQ